MTQLLTCQKCGEDIDTVLTGLEMIVYHKNCWVEFQQEIISAARGKLWHKLEGSDTTEYYESDVSDIT